MTTAEELIRILEGDEGEDFELDAELNIDEEVFLFHRFISLSID